MPRKDMTLAERIALLDKIKSHPPNTSQRKLAQLLGVSKSTLARILQQEETLRNQWSNKEGAFQKRKREGKDPLVEKALSKWFSSVTSQGASVSGPMLKQKAEELADKLGHHGFKASNGWLSRWKCRHGIKFKKSHDERTSAETWKDSKLPEIMKKYSPDDIYNADETGLYYRAMPDGSLCYKHFMLSGSRKPMERITVLCCTNMSGSDKLKLLVIGKARCFKQIRMESLPVHYYFNKRAWITSAIFSDWLRAWDNELQKKSRKICLLIDNCPAHPNVDVRNIQIEFLPPNTMSLLQPLNMGIIKNFKMIYRSKLISYVLQEIEGNTLTSSATAEDVSAHVNLLKAIQFVADSWDEVKISTIKNCFAKSGLNVIVNDDVETVEIDDDYFFLQLQVQNFEEFSNIDENIQCYKENESSDEEVIKKCTGTQQLDEIEEAEDEANVNHVSIHDAKKFIDGLQQYFIQEGSEGSPLEELKVCAKFVERQVLKERRQSKLKEYFQKV